MGKPRMTQRDKWKKRPAVLRYHAFKDELKLRVGSRIPQDVDTVSWIVYFPMPKSWSKKKKAAMAGEKHRQKPDRDNIDKAILDAIFPEDSGISDGELKKRWDDGNGARIVLSWNE